MVFCKAFENCNRVISMRYHISGSFFFNTDDMHKKTKVCVSSIRDMLCADDCDRVAHTEEQNTEPQGCIY